MSVKDSFRAAFQENEQFGEQLAELAEDAGGQKLLDSIEGLGWTMGYLEEVFSGDETPDLDKLKLFLSDERIASRETDERLGSLRSLIKLIDLGSGQAGDEVDGAVETGEQPESTAVSADGPVEVGSEATEGVGSEQSDAESTSGLLDEPDDEAEGPFATLRDSLGHEPIPQQADSSVSEEDVIGQSAEDDEVVDQSAGDEETVADESTGDPLAAPATEETKEKPDMSNQPKRRGGRRNEPVMYRFVREGQTYEVNLKGPGVRTYFGMRVDSLRGNKSWAVLAKLFDKTRPFFPNMMNKDSGDLQPNVVEGVAEFLGREPWEFLSEAPGVKPVAPTEPADVESSAAPADEPDTVDLADEPAQSDAVETAAAPADEPVNDLRDATSPDDIVADDAGEGTGDEVVGDGLDPEPEDYDKKLEELVRQVDWKKLFFRANDAGLIPEERFRTVTEDYISLGADVDFMAEFVRAFEVYQAILDRHDLNDFEILMDLKIRRFMESVSMLDLAVIVMMCEREEEQSDSVDVQVEDPS